MNRLKTLRKSIVICIFLKWAVIPSLKDTFERFGREDGTLGIRRKRLYFIKILKFRDDFYIPNLISCPIPKRFQNSVDILVSLSYEPCKSENNAMQVAIPETIDDSKKKSVAVCVKGMNFQVGNNEYFLPSKTTPLGRRFSSPSSMDRNFKVIRSRHY